MRMLIVKDEVAQRQLAAEAAAAPPAAVSTSIGLDLPAVTTSSSTFSPDNPGSGVGPGPGIAPPSQPVVPTQRTTFTGSLKLDPVRAGLQMGQFLEEVMSHLQALPGAEVNLSVEVHVKAPNGIDDQTARIVLENAAALKLDNPQVY